MKCPNCDHEMEFEPEQKATHWDPYIPARWLCPCGYSEDARGDEEDRSNFEHASRRDHGSI